MTNDERIAFLSENTINSRWVRKPNNEKWWTVSSFYSTGYGPSFEAALDDAIWDYQKREAKWVTGERKAVPS